MQNMHKFIIKHFMLKMYIVIWQWMLCHAIEQCDWPSSNTFKQRFLAKEQSNSQAVCEEEGWDVDA